MPSNLAGKVALVTGSSAGIGKAIALKFAENGANLILHGKDPTPELGQDVVKEVISLGREAIFEEADINNYPEVKRMVDRGIERFGKIDILVVSGGAVALFGKARFFRDTDPEDYFDLAKIQWLNRAYCVKAAINYMIERQSGKIVMLGTDAGRWPTPGESMVGASGAALVLMTKTLAQEFARWKIRINTISLTVISDSPLIRDMLDSDHPVAKVFKKALEKQPFPVTQNDIAEAALFLASDLSDAITGQTLSINGGLCYPG